MTRPPFSDAVEAWHSTFPCALLQTVASTERQIAVDWPVASVILGTLATIITGILRATPSRHQQDVSTDIEVLKVQYQGLQDQLQGLRTELHKLREMLVKWHQQEKDK